MALETVVVCNYQNADCSFREKNIIASFLIIFGGTLSFQFVIIRHLTILYLIFYVDVVSNSL